MRTRRFLLAGLSAAMFANMLTGCAVPVVLSDLTEINRPELMKQAKAEWEAYEKTEAIVLATEDALHQAAPNEALNWEFASEAAKRAVEETSRLYLLEAAAGYAKVQEMRAEEKWQQVEQELAQEDWGIVAEILLRMTAISDLSSTRNESKKAEAARFSPESVAAADNAIRSTSEALNAASNVLKQEAPTEWAIRLTAVAERDIAWAALNQAVDLIAKGQNVNPVPPESVRVFQMSSIILPKHVKIGVLTSKNADKKRIISAMRKKAGELGANGLIFSTLIISKNDRRGMFLSKNYPEYRGTVIRILEETEDRE